MALDPAEEDRRAAERFAETRRVVLELYEAFEAEAWVAAVEILSNETRILLAGGANEGAADALATGQVVLDGDAYRIDPVELFLLADPDGFEDTVEGEQENETSRRKEIFIVSGEVERRVVLIEEGGAWRVHLRRLPIERLIRGE